MIINPEMAYYIKLQRTGYGNGNISDCFEKDINSTYFNIQKHLPKKAQSILDIGCGIGGIDLAISNHYNGNISLNLLDYSEQSELYYGFKDNAAKYNHLGLTHQFLTLNGVAKENIHIHDAKNGYPLGKFDIIISLLSCGFHYPVETYLQKIKESKAGIIILDIRKNTGQMDVLKENFYSVEIIAEFTKCERVLIK